MVKREIVSIDEEKCDGCGLCLPACHEGAIEIVDGKARLKEEKLCDGLGDCLGECPQDAITIEVREAEEFDEEAVAQEMAKNKRTQKKSPSPCSSARVSGGGCPSAQFNNLDTPSDKGQKQSQSRASKATEQKESHQKSTTVQSSGTDDINLSIKSQLNQWPVQLSLLPEQAPIFQDADLLISADCVAHAYADFHLDLLKDRKLVIGCPKLDDNNYYIEKLTSIFANNDIKSLTVALMEVPCCGGLKYAVKQALQNSGKDIPVKEIVISVKGEKKE